MPRQSLLGLLFLLAGVAAQTYANFGWSTEQSEVLETSITVRVFINVNAYDLAYGVISATKLASNPSTTDIQNGVGNIDAGCLTNFNGALTAARQTGGYIPLTFSCNTNMPHGKYYYVYLAFRPIGTTNLVTGDPNPGSNNFPMAVFSTPSLNPVSVISNTNVIINGPDELTFSWTNPTEIASSPVPFASVSLELMKDLSTSYYQFASFYAFNATQSIKINTTFVNNPTYFNNNGSVPIYFRVLIIQSTTSIGPFVYPQTGKVYLAYKPSAPTMNTPTVKDRTTMSLSWAAPSTTGGTNVPLKEYLIQPSQNSGFSDNLASVKVAAPGLTYDMTGLNSNVTWYFRIRAYNTLPADRVNLKASDEQGPWSATTSKLLIFNPDPPANVAIVPIAPDKVEITWDERHDGGSTITSYFVYFQPQGTPFGSGISATCAVPGACKTTIQCQSNRTYHAAVAAVNSVGTSPKSPEASALFQYAPSVVNSLALTPVSTSSVNATWSIPSLDGGRVLTDFLISVCETAQLNVCLGSRVENFVPNQAAYAHTITGMTKGTNYTVTVSASNGYVGSGTSVIRSPDVSSPIKVQFTPAAPTGVIATVYAVDAIKVSWTLPDNGGLPITKYHITYSSGSLPSQTQVYTPNATQATNFIWSGLPSKSASQNQTADTFFFTVQAENAAVNAQGVPINSGNGDGKSPVSSSSAGVVLSGPPGVAVNFTGVILDPKNLYFEWAAPPLDGGALVTKYDFYLSTAAAGFAGISPIVVTKAEYDLTSATPGASYIWKVVSYNGAGAGPESSTQTLNNFFSPDKPASINVTILNWTSIRVAWTPPQADGGSSITNYLITGTHSNGTVVSTATVSGVARTKDFYGLLQGATYSFDVIAVNSVGFSLKNSVTVQLIQPPSSVRNIVLTNLVTQMNVTWDPPSSNGGVLTDSIVLVWGTGGSATTQTISCSGGCASGSYLLTGLTSGLTYSINLTAHNSVGFGPSIVVSKKLTYEPRQATGLAVSVRDATSVAVTWVPPVDVGGEPVTTYTISYVSNGIAGGSASHSGSSNVASSVNVTLNPAVVSSLQMGDTYNFSVTASNSIGQGPKSTVVSTAVVFKPAAPSNIAVALQNSSSASISWNGPATNGGLPISYNLNLLQAGNVAAIQSHVVTPSSQFPNSTATTQNKVLTGLTASLVEYSVRITTSNSLGTSSEANTTFLLVFKPSPPSVSSAKALSSTSIELLFTDPSDNGGAPIDLFRVQKKFGNGAWSFVGPPFSNPSQLSVKKVNVTGLVANSTTAYSFRMAAHNPNTTINGGWSNFSSPLNFTLTYSPSQPTAFAAVPNSATQFNVSWAAVADTGSLPVSHYQLTVIENNTQTPAFSSVESNAVTFKQITLPKEKAYIFNIRANNSFGWGPLASVGPVVLEAMPDPPTLTSLVKNQTSIELTASIVNTGGRQISSFETRYREQGTVPWTTFTSNYNSGQTLNAQKIVVGSLTAGKTYEFQVRAQNALGVSFFSSPEVTVLRFVATAPSVTSINAVSLTAATLTWAKPAQDGGVVIDGYTITFTDRSTGVVVSTNYTNATSQAINGSAPSNSVSLTSLTLSHTYDFSVIAQNALGASPSSNNFTYTFLFKPSAPALATHRTLSANTIEFVLNPPSNNGGSVILGYEIELNVTQNSTDNVSQTSVLSIYAADNSTTNKITALTSGKFYVFSFRALNAQGASPWSVASNKTQLLWTPDTPVVGSRTVQSETKIALQWQAAAETGGSPIQSYVVETYSNQTFNQASTVSHNSSTPTQSHVFTYGSSDLGKYFSFRVRASNAQGNSSFSAFTNDANDRLVYYPFAVQNFTAVRHTVNEVRLSWSAPASDGGLALGAYTIQYGQSGVGNTTTATTSGLAYAIPGLTAGNTYFFRVAAQNSKGLGPYTADFNVTLTDTPKAPNLYPISQIYPPICPPPFGTRCLVGSDSSNAGKFTLFVEWNVLTTAVETGGLSVTKYKVELSQDVTFANASVPIISVNVSTSGAAGGFLSTTITNLTGGQSLFVRVSGYNNLGYGTPSTLGGGLGGAVLIGGKPAKPVVNSVYPYSSSQFAINVSAGADTGGLPIQMFRASIKYNKQLPNGTFYISVCDHVTTASNALMICPNLIADAAFDYLILVVVRNSKNLESQNSNVIFTKLTFNPSVPQNVALAIPTSTSINCDWSPPADLAGYTLNTISYELAIWKQNPSNNAIFNLTNYTLTGNNTNFPSLTQGAEYYVHLRARNGYGASAYSPTTRITLNFPPSTPRNVSSTMLTSTSAQLTWQTPLDLGGSLIVDYRIVATDSATNTSTTTLVGSNATTYTLSGLTRGATLNINIAAQTTFTKFASNPWPKFGNSSSTHVRQVIFPCSAPLNLTATTADFTPDATIKWLSPTDLGGLPIQQFDINFTHSSNQTNVVSIPIANLTVQGSSFVWIQTGLLKGKTYTMQVRAINAAGNGVWSASFARKITYSPSAPANLTVLVEGTLPNLQLKVSYPVPSDDGGAPILNYIINPQRTFTSAMSAVPSVAGNQLVATSTSLTVTSMLKLSSDTVKSSLIAGDYYSVSVTAQNTANHVSRSSPIVQVLLALPPAAPSLTAVALDSQSVKVTISPPASNGGSVLLNYTIFWKLTGSVESSQTYTIPVGQAVNTFDLVLGNLTRASQYSIQAVAVNGKSAGPRSSAINVVVEHAPTAVRNVTLTPKTPTTLQVDWVVPADDGGRSISVYQIEYSNSSTVLVNTSAATSFTLNSSLVLGAVYAVKVRAVNVIGSGPYSVAATSLFALPPAQPTINATITGTVSVKVDWTVPAAQGSPITSYVVTATDSSSAVSTQNVSASFNTFTFANLTGPSPYTFKVWAINAFGSSTQASVAFSLLFTPDPPVNVNGRSGTYDNLTVTWSDGNLGGGTFQSYTLYVSDNNFTTDLLSKTTTNKYYVFKDSEKLTLNKTYWFAVTVTTNIGTSARSLVGAQAEYLYQFLPIVPVVDNAKTKALTARSVRLFWNINSVSGLSVSFYTVYWSTNPAFISSASKAQAPPILGENNYDVTGLVAGQTYYFKVSASNFLGEGNLSATSNPVVMITKPDAPGNFTAVVTDFTTVRLRWFAPFDGASTLVRYNVNLFKVGSNSSIKTFTVAANASNTAGNLVTNTPANLFTLTDQGSSFYLTITAENTAPTSTVSDIATSNTFSLVFPPSKPQNFAVVVEALNRLKLTWSQPQNVGGFSASSISYTVSWDESSYGGAFRNSKSYNSSVLSETIVFADNDINKTFSLQISASNAAGVGSAATTNSSLIFVPFPVKSVSTPAVTASKTVRVSFVADTRGPPLIGAKIYAYSNGSLKTEHTATASEANAGSTQVLFSPSDQGESFTFRVSTLNSQGQSLKSNTTVPVPLIWRPGTFTPSALKFANNPSSPADSLDVSFPRIGDTGGLPITKYYVYYSLSSNFSVIDAGTKKVELSPTPPATEINPALTNFTLTISSLINGRYYFRIGCRNTNPDTNLQESLLSAETSFNFVYQPDAPQGFVAAPSGLDYSSLKVTASLSWVPPNSRGNAIDYYTIMYQNAGSQSVRVSAPTPGGVVPNTTAIGNLTLGQSYVFTIAAHNAQGNSASSSTSPIRMAWVPGKVLSLASKIKTTTSVELTWSIPATDGASNLTQYEVLYSQFNKPDANLLVGTNTTTPDQTSIVITNLVPKIQYFFWVRAINAMGKGALSDSSSIFVLNSPSAPSKLDAFVPSTPAMVHPDNETVSLSWHSPADDGGRSVIKYRIWYVHTKTPANFTKDFNVSTAPFLDTSSSALSFQVPVSGFGGEVFFFKVAAINGITDAKVGTVYGAVSGVGPSGGVAVTYVPGQPVNATFSRLEAGTVRVGWAAPNFSGYSPTDYYTVTWYSNDQLSIPLGTQNTQNLTADVPGLVVGKTYKIEVQAHNAVGFGKAYTFSSVSVLSVPASPGLSSVTVISSSSVNVSWITPASNGGSNITSYIIMYATDLGFSANSVKFIVSDPTSRSAVVAVNTSIAKLWQFKIVAVNIMGESPASAVKSVNVVVVPSAVSTFNISVTPETRNSISLAWSAPVDGGDTILYYNVFWSLNTSFLGNSKITSDLTSTISGLVAGSTYFFKIRAVNRVGNGEFSAVQNFTLLVTPIAPQNVGVFNTGKPSSAAVTVNFTAIASAPDNGGANVTGYSVYFTTQRPPYDWSKRSSFGKVDVSGPSASITEAQGQLTPGNRYFFLVTASSSVGESLWQTFPSPLEGVYIANHGAPQAPTNLVLSVDGKGATATVSATWTAPPVSTEKDPLPILKYKICVGSKSVNFTCSEQAVSITNFSTGILPVGEVASVDVSAVNAYGQGSEASTTVAVQVVPGKVLGVSGQAFGPAQAMVNWTQTASNGGAPILKYIVNVYQNKDELKKRIELLGNSTLFTVITLPADKYWFTVSAINSKGEGEASDVSEAVTVEAKSNGGGSADQSIASVVTVSKIKLVSSSQEWNKYIPLKSLSNKLAFFAELAKELASVMGVDVHRVVFVDVSVVEILRHPNKPMRQLLRETKDTITVTWAVLEVLDLVSNAKTPAEAIAIYEKELSLFLDPKTKSLSKFSNAALLETITERPPQNPAAQVLSVHRCDDGSYVMKDKKDECPPKPPTVEPPSDFPVMYVAIGGGVTFLLLVVIAYLVCQLKKRKKYRTREENLKRMATLSQGVEMQETGEGVKDKVSNTYGSISEDISLELEVEEY